MSETNQDEVLILTFGYGNRTNYDTFLEYLKKFNVAYVIDVREKPRAWSQKWYAKQIQKVCSDSGIQYLSETSLGNISGTNQWIPPDPKKAEEALHDLAKKAASKTVLLLCAERDCNRCHRVEVANQLYNLIHHSIKHLS